MTHITNHTEYTAAVNEAKLHDYRYFTLNAPTISDEQYDALYFAIQDYETAHPDKVLADSPTQSAHAEVKNGHKQIRRRTEMLSTEKAQTIDKVQKWMKKTTKKLCAVAPGASANLYTVEWKYDGISLSLVYIDGQLTEASYGKGMEGNDCLQHCLKVASIPNTIPAAGRVEVRGEMLVPFANLAKTGYKNCRSAASGIMADTASTLTECLEFHPYWADFAGREHKDAQSLFMDMHLDWGFIDNVASFCCIDEIEKVIERKTAKRESLSFPTDGLVIKVADSTKWDSLGRNDHHPHYAIAYKFAAATAETTIKDIQITTGKTGKRTPVAYFEPVVINGSTYQKASIGSEAKLAELGIEVGSRVIVSLRNDVIPHIDGKALPSNPLPSEGVEADTTEPSEPRNVEEHRVIAEPEIEENPCSEEVPQIAQIDTEENSCSEEKENPCQSVESVGAPYTPPTTTSVIINTDPVCSGYPPRADRPRRPRRYKMVDEPRTRTATVAQEPESATWQKVAGGIAATIAVIAIAALLFSTIGIAVFLLPLLAGAFK